MARFINGVHENIIRKRRRRGRRHATKELRYLRISAGPQRGMYVHVLVAMAKIGRRLFPWEEVDHIDTNTFNNHPDNLQVVIDETHGALTRARERRDETAATVDRMEA